MSFDPSQGVQPKKFSLFGSRKAAQSLAEENEYLRAQLAQLGALDLYNIQQQTAAASEHFNAAHAEATRILGDLERQKAARSQELQALNAHFLNVRDGIDLQEVGIYNFEHPAENSARLAERLVSVRAAIKQAVKDGNATSATSGFTFNNSAKQGERFIKQMSTMMLSAYNAEAENCIKAVKAGGLNTARARLDKVVDRVEKNGTMINLQITSHYHKLRLEELALAAQHMDALQAERELERERKAELREQQKAEQELRRERERLNKERDHYLNALAALQARGDVEGAAELQAKLADVDRAIETVDYRTANMRAGYVYVISNVGAFGKSMVKIGMTRRLDPMDRVRELGDASVPFRFDVHALFFADDAVAVETMLHNEFADRRVNRINPRREFFYCTPEDVLNKLKAHNVSLVTYNMEPDAEEFRLSEAARGVSV